MSAHDRQDGSEGICPHTTGTLQNMLAQLTNGAHLSAVYSRQLRCTCYRTNTQYLEFTGPIQLHTLGVKNMPAACSVSWLYTVGAALMLTR